MTLQNSTGFYNGAVTIILCTELRLRHVNDIAISGYDGYNIPKYEVGIYNIMLEQYNMVA
jgi:hypothetical protein